MSRAAWYGAASETTFLLTNAIYTRGVEPLEYLIRPVTPDDRIAVVDIFNYYVEHTFAAYPEQKVPYEFFSMLVQLAKGYPFYVVESGGAVAGYGLLRPHSPMSSFRRTAELTCFIAPDYTGKGLGKAVLGRLTADAKAAGIDTILASVSSANEGSICFHRQCGFVECGTFRRAGRKFGKDFDETWMQLHL